MKNFSHKFLKTFVILSACLFLLSGCTYFDQIKSSFKPEEQQPVEQTQQVDLIITDHHNEASQAYQLTYTEGETAYEFLNRAVLLNSDLQVEFSDFEFDGETKFFVKAINGYDPSPDNSFWAFYLGENQSPLGVSDYVINPDDQIIFKVEEIQN